jgi:hypothetical protein
MTEKDRMDDSWKAQESGRRQAVAKGEPEK